jgi:ATPase family AAA domain-containing protein 3A/B
VGDGVTEFLSDPQKMLTTIGVVSGLALGVYAARAGTSVAAQQVTRRLAVPPLVRETSRKSLLLNPIAALRSGFRSKGDPLEGIILPPMTTERLKDITIATANARQNR